MTGVAGASAHLAPTSSRDTAANSGAAAQDAGAQDLDAQDVAELCSSTPSEAGWLACYNPADHPACGITADAVIIALHPTPHIALIERAQHPYKGHWALPGGFKDATETFEQAAARELREETGIDATDLQLVGVYGNPGRDPRGHIITAAYTATIDTPYGEANDDATQLTWWPVTDIENGTIELAFDHHRIIADALATHTGTLT